MVFSDIASAIPPTQSIVVQTERSCESLIMEILEARDICVMSILRASVVPENLYDGRVRRLHEHAPREAGAVEPDEHLRRLDGGDALRAVELAEVDDAKTEIRAE